MTHERYSRNRVELGADCRGVTMMQFALVLPLLMGAVAIIIDIGRYYAAQNVLDYGAREGVEVASMVRNLDVNLDGHPTDSVSYIRYVEARRRVAEAATKTPLATLVANFDEDSDIRLIRHDYTDPVAVAGDETQPSYSYGAALVRPYERVKRVRPSGDVSWIEHPQKPYLEGRRRNIVVAMETAPIVVEVSAELNLLLPFMKPLVITGRAAGYRRWIPNGPFDQETEERIGTWDDYLASLTTTTTQAPGTTTATSSTTTTTICRADWAYCNTSDKLDLFPPNISSLCPNPTRNDGSGFCACVPCSEALESSYGLPSN